MQASFYSKEHNVTYTAR